MTTNIGSLAVSLSLDSSNFNGSIDRVNRNLGAMGSELRAVQALGGQYGNSLEGLRSKKDILTRSVGASTLKLEEERRKYDALVSSGTANEAQLERQARRVNEAQTQFNRLTTELGSVEEALRRQSSSWTQYGERMTAAGTKIKAIGDGMQQVGKKMTTHVTAPLLALGTGAFKAAVDFESAFAGVRKTVDATEDEFAVLSTGIREMAKEIPAAATEIAKVAEAAGQLGIEKEAILGFTRTMVDLGVATNMSSDEAATALARLANITNMNQQDFDRLGSSIVELGNNFATTEKEIVDMALRLAGAGAQVGMSEADILALATALSSVGIEAEMGGSAMSRVMVNMQVATSTGFTKVQELMKKTGMSVRDLQMMASHSGKAFGHLAEDLGMTKKELTALVNAGVDLEGFSKVAGMTGEQFKQAFEKDAVGALGAFIDGLANAEDAGSSAINILQEMGITEIRLRDSLLRAGGASELFANAVQLSNGAWVDNNALTNEAEERYKTMASQMTIVWNQVKDLGITLGNILIPKVVLLMEKITPLIDGFANMSTESQTMILAIGGIAAAAGPVIVVFGSLMSGIGGLITVAGAASTAIGAAGGLGATLLGLAGPIGIAVGVVGVLGVAYQLLKVDADRALKSQEAMAENNLELAKSHTEVLGEQLKQTDATSELISNTLEQAKSVDTLITSYEGLIEKSELTTDEFGEFLTLQTQLEGTKSPERIAELEERMNGLREKSGLSSEEFAKLLESNTLLTEQFPNASAVVDEYGNSIADTTGKLREMTAAELERKEVQVYNKMVEDLRALNNEIDGYEDILMNVVKLEGEVASKKNEITDIQKSINQNETTQKGLQSEILAIKEQQKDASFKEHFALEVQKNELILQNGQLEQKNKKHNKNLEVLESTLATEEATLAEMQAQRDKVEKLIDSNGRNYEAYTKILEAQFDINIEKGKENESLDKAISKRNEEIKQLESKIKKEGDSNGNLQEAINNLKTENDLLSDAHVKLGSINGTLDTQVTKFDAANDELKKVNNKFMESGKLTDENTKKAEEWNKLLDKNNIKNVTVISDKDPDEENRKWSSPITKLLNIRAGAQPAAYAKGTNSHRGGPFIAGEEGFELGRMGKKWEVLNFGMYNRPAGYEVFTHGESKRILGKINHMPAYATGANQGVGNLNSLNTSNIELKIISEMSGVITASQGVGKNLMDAVGKVLTDATKKNADDVAKINKEAEEKRVTLQNDFAKKRAEIERKTAQSSQSALKTSKNKKGEIVTTGAKRVQNIRNDAAAKLIKLDDDTAKKLAAINTKEAADVLKRENQLNKEKLDAIKLFVQDKKSTEELSHVAESEIWRKSLTLFQDGTKERVEIQKAYQASLKAINDEVLKFNGEYGDKMLAINDRLRKEEEDLTNMYVKSVDDRAKSLVTFAGTFDEFEVKLEKTGEDLMWNLKSQVLGFKRWQEEIDELSKKAIDDGLIDELEQMGPKALPQLIALNSLTDKQMSEYSALYKEKSKLAREQAEKEMAPLKANTEKQITELRTAANKELGLLQNDWTNKIKSITKTTDDELKSLKSIGKNAGQGLLDGLASMEGSLVAKARSIAQAVSDAMASALEVRSPSRVTMRIGGFVGEGLEKGMESKFKAVANAGKRLANAVIQPVGEYAMPNYAGMNGGRGSNGSNDNSRNYTGGNTTINVYGAQGTPSEIARKQKQAQRQMALEWGYQ